MKNIYRVLVLLFAFAILPSVSYSEERVNVNDFEGFNEALANSLNLYNICFSSDISVNATLNHIDADDFYIDGSNFSLDGNGEYFGFENQKYLAFENIVLKNFSNSSDTSFTAGAIKNSGNLVINASTLSYNTASNIASDDTEYNYAGAIYNSGNVLIEDSSFFYNSARNFLGALPAGGAIYNDGILNISALDKNVEFTGNTANSISNAVYNSSNAVMNLNASASSNTSIIFNDEVDGDGGTININYDNGLHSDGTIEFNNYVRGNDINVYAGTLKLGSFEGATESFGEEVHHVAPSKGRIGTITSRNALTVYDGAVVDMANGDTTDTVYISSFCVVSGTANIKLDVNLLNSSSDKINISQNAFGDGKLSFYGMNILNDFKTGVYADIKIFTDSETMTVNYLDEVDFVTYGSSGVYRITQGEDNLSLKFFLTEYTSDPFQHSVSTQTGDRAYNLDRDYNMPGEYVSTLSSGTLHIIGNGATIHGNGISNVFSLEDANSQLDVSGIVITDALSEKGGAIFNLSTVNVSSVVFRANTASSTVSEAFGGAIYNENILNIYDSSFYENVAVGSTAFGGAIYSKGGYVNIISQNSNVFFSNNIADGQANAAHLADGAVFNLNSYEGKYIVFNDPLTSSGEGNILNLNASSADEASVLLSSRTSGTIYINTDMSSFANTDSSSGNIVALYGGSIKLAPGATFFKDIKFDMYGATRLDMLNGAIDNISVADFNLPDTDESYLSIDVNLRTQEADNLKGSVFTGGEGKLVIDEIFILKDVDDIEKSVAIEIADDDNLKNILSLKDSRAEIYGPVLSYFAEYDNGQLLFKYTFDFNPSVFIAPVTLQTGGYLGQLNSYRQAFSIIDKTLSEEGSKGLWVRPYSYSEDVELYKKLTVKNTAYGAYAGYTSSPSDIGKDINGVFSIYGAYNACDQTYKDATIDQGGGLLGVTAVFFKEKFYTAFTLNSGIVSEHGKTDKGKDNFMMYTKGIALKTGYNFHTSNDKFIIQPSLDLSCSIMTIAPYTNTAGVKVDVGRFAPVHIEPGIKIASEIAKQLNSFFNFSAVFSLADKTDCKADDIELPEMEVKSYIQYGLGVEKAFSETFSLGGEFYGRSLGRKGVGGEINAHFRF